MIASALKNKKEAQLVHGQSSKAFFFWIGVPHAQQNRGYQPNPQC
jgi:hypothetical protein